MTNDGHSTEADIAVYLGLGSNVGDREANLRQATERISTLGLEVVRESSIYETEPVGFREQPWFLNQVLEVSLLDELTSEFGPVIGDPETVATIQAEALLSQLLNIEHEMGRERSIVNGPRLIDIDLLLFGNTIIAHSREDEEWSSINRPDLFVPHPRMHTRRFVLEPLCEIAPDLVHPGLEKTCCELLAQLDDPSTVTLFRKRDG